MGIKNRIMAKTTTIKDREYGINNQGRLYEKLYGAYKGKNREYHLEGRWYLVRWAGTGLAYVWLIKGLRELKMAKGLKTFKKTFFRVRR